MITSPYGGPHGAAVIGVLMAALAAADPYLAVSRVLGTNIEIRDAIASARRIYVLGAGKAGAAMARAVEDVLGDRIAAGMVVIKEGHTPTEAPPLMRVNLKEARHPLPDQRGVEATVEMLDLAHQAEEGDLVLCLISGGGSALLTAPAEGISLEDVQEVTGLLLRSGATINELNAVRKHLSRVSGGMLARAAAPARVVSLILSDVVGSPLDVIASGPTAPDPTTFGEALSTLDRYGLLERVPRPVAVRLLKGAQGNLEEAPKPDDPLFGRVTNIIVASNVLAVEAAASHAQNQGLNSMVMSTFIEGEAREVAKVLAALAREIAVSGRPISRPACLLFGGETTVTVRGSGAGGRNTELALSAAFALGGMGEDVLVASFATDGGDGSAPCAGAIVDGTTIDKATTMGLDAHSYLADNDSYTLLSKVGSTIVTGPTGTNVNDVIAVFVL